MTIEKGREEKNRSMFTLVSYSVFGFGAGSAFGFINAYLLYFYEVEVGLPIFFFTIAMVIYSIWDTVNDPLVGYFSDKPHFYTKRWGRRFPLIVIGMIPVSFLFYFIFSPPDIDPVENAIVITIWLTSFLCLTEFFATVSGINVVALFPQKFRTDRDRRFINGFGVVVLAGMRVFGMVLPPLFIVYGDKSSFLTAGLIIVLISIPFLIIGIPGVREDKKLIEQFFKSEELAKVKDNFFVSMKKLLKNRNFVAITLISIPLNICGALAVQSIIYFVRYVLQVDVIWTGVVMLVFLVASVMAIPFWVWVIGKVGAFKVAYIGIIGLGLALFLNLFVNDVHSGIIVAVIVAFFTTGWDCADVLLFASVLDEVVVNERRHQEGVYSGVRSIILHIGPPLVTIIFAITHAMTGFDPHADVQTPLAQWGIRADLGLIPMILALVAVLILWKGFTLTPERIETIKAQLRELDI